MKKIALKILIILVTTHPKNTFLNKQTSLRFWGKLIFKIFCQEIWNSLQKKYEKNLSVHRRRSNDVFSCSNQLITN